MRKATDPSPVESALARALSEVRHTDECHSCYGKYKESRDSLTAHQKSCLKCITNSRDEGHSKNCGEAYKVFLVARRMMKDAQAGCGKCQARAQLRGK